MKFLFDLLPVLLFFVAFRIPADPRQGIMLATGVAITAALIQLAYHWFRHRRVEKMLLATTAIILVLGGATLIFRNEEFIKWKPTVVNWLFALSFLISQFVGSKNLVQRMLDQQMQLPAPIWARLNGLWVVFFAAMGAANLYVAHHFDTATWVNFKLFGIMGLTLAFVIGQAVYLARFIELETDTERKP
jgi:intracellular septation protein